MTKSMTAYGRGSTDSLEGRWVVELHSVNRKSLEIQIFLPRDCLVFDMALRKWMAPFVQRGQVTMRITLQRDDAASLIAGVVPKLKNLQASWSQIASELGYDPQTIDLRFLLERMATQGGSERQDEAGLEIGLKKAFEEAVKDWQAMRELEGRALAKDIELRLKLMSDSLEEIERNAPRASEEYRLKLAARLAEVCQDLAANEERVIREAALMAEKIDISEEITRMNSHFLQMKNLLKSSEKSIGRTMEFLVQEMHREMNTIGSKSADLEISRLVVAMKAELEKIREQVQNIE